MSSELPTLSNRFRQQLERWLSNNRGDAFLGTGSKDAIRRELRTWIDRRLRNYFNITALTATDQQRLQELIDCINIDQVSAESATMRNLEPMINEYFEQIRVRSCLSSRPFPLPSHGE